MVPATSCTTDRSEPASRLSNELLPTFGGPATTTEYCFKNVAKITKIETKALSTTWTCP